MKGMDSKNPRKNVAHCDGELMNKKSLVYVDDEFSNHKMLQQLLGNEYALSFFKTAADVMACKDLSADLILLDVQMPGINGYQLCEHLRAIAYEKPVLFLSAYHSVDDRLLAYQAGGDDFIAKPFHIDELTIKIKNNLERYATVEKIKNDLSQASATAMAAMNSASEMGVVLLFTQRVLNNETLEQLSNSLNDALRSYGLNAVFRLQLEQSFYRSTSGSALNPLEKELLDAYDQLDKIVTHGRRCLLSSPKVSILIKNMPESAEKAGRFRDHLALIHDTTQQCLNFLKVQSFQKNLHTQFMDELRQHMQHIVSHIDTRSAQSRQRIGHLIENIKNELFGLELKLDLNDTNAAILQAISGELKTNLDEITDDFDDIEQQINLLIDTVQTYRPT